MDDIKFDSILKNSIVSIVTDVRCGSGFFVGNNLVLTCAHVVSCIDESQYFEKVKVTLNHTSKKGKVIFYKSKPYPDIALIEVEFTNHTCLYLENDLSA